MDMTDEVRKALQTFIEQLAASGRYDRLNLSFFGGEPLMRYQQTVKPLLECAHRACQAQGMQLDVHFTTNGYLLTDEMLRELEPYHTSLQIPIDGNEAVHNRVKRTETDSSTYRRIIGNIHLALAHGLSVGVRLNYTTRYLPSFIDVLTDFQDLDAEARRRMNFDFQQVWQDSQHTDDTRATLLRLTAAFRDAGFYVNSEENRSPAFCYADKRNHLTINYDGGLYHCTARDFKPERAEGRLQSDGTITTNERHDRRMAIRWGNETCRQCRAYPICHGGCSQHKLEYDRPTGCLKGYSPEQREDLLRRRLLWLVEDRYRTLHPAKPAQ